MWPKACKTTVWVLGILVVVLVAGVAVMVNRGKKGKTTWIAKLG